MYCFCNEALADMMDRTRALCCMRMRSSDSIIIMEMDWRLLGITSPAFAQTRGFFTAYYMDLRKQFA